MIEVESLKDYSKVMDDDEFMKLAIDIYQITDFICADYPGHKSWYFNKHLPEILSDQRNILFVRNPQNLGEIIAVACLKKDENEQKICTLYVSDKCRGLGIGTMIIEESMKWLGTTKPLVTMADYKLDMFSSIIKKYDWELTEIVEGFYNKHSKELCFNGSLTKKDMRTIKTRKLTKLG